jgi:membrane protein DedA with SNARE-associated domain
LAERLLDALASLPTLPTYLVLMALSALENVFPPAPADVAVALGAFLAHRGELSAPLLGVVCWLSNTASAAWLYLLARRRGPRFLREGWGARLMPEHERVVVERMFRRHGALGIFLTRFLPGVRAAVLPFAGAFGLSPARTLLPAAFASAVWYAFLIVAGTLLGRNWESVKSVVGDVSRVLGLVAVAAVIVAAWWYRRMKRRSTSG